MATTTTIYLGARQMTTDDSIGMLWLPPQQTTVSTSHGAKKVFGPVDLQSQESSVSKLQIFLPDDDDGYETPDLPLSDTEDDGWRTEEYDCVPNCRCGGPGCQYDKDYFDLETDDGVVFVPKPSPPKLVRTKR